MLSDVIVCSAGTKRKSSFVEEIGPNESVLYGKRSPSRHDRCNSNVLFVAMSSYLIVYVQVVETYWITEHNNNNGRRTIESV